MNGIFPLEIYNIILSYNDTSWYITRLVCKDWNYCISGGKYEGVIWLCKLFTSSPYRIDNNVSTSPKLEYRGSNNFITINYGNTISTIIITLSYYDNKWYRQRIVNKHGTY